MKRSDALLTAILLAACTLAAAPVPIWSGRPAVVKGDRSCPVLLFGVDGQGKILDGKELVRSGACGWPDVAYDGETYARDTRPSLAERTQFAQVVLSCDHIFASETETPELSAWIQTSPLQLDVPARFRIKARLQDYLINLAQRDHGVWVFGRGKATSDQRPAVVGCKPRDWSPFPAPAERRVSRSELLVVRHAKALEVPDYKIPDEALAAPAIFSGASDTEQRIPAEMSFPGK